jgi:hypothetical protein
MLDTNFEDRVYKKLQRVSAEGIFVTSGGIQNFWEAQKSPGAAQDPVLLTRPQQVPL